MSHPSPGLSRRGLLGLGGASAAAALLAACGGESSGSSSSSSGFTYFMWSGSTAEVTAWKKVAADASKSIGKPVTFQTAAWNDYWTKLTSESASGKIQDIIGMQSLRAPQFKDALIGLDSHLSAMGVKKADFDENIFKALTVDGKIRAIPYDFGPLLIFYNKTAFAAAGLPTPAAGWTTDDFMNAARKLTSGGKYGFFPSAYIDAMIPWVMSAGGKQAVTADGKLDVDNDIWHKTVTWYRSLITTEKVAAPLPAANSAAASTSQFLSGNAMMTVDGPWSLINAKAQAKFDVGVVPMPVGDGGSMTTTSGSGFGVSTSCKDPSVAAKAVGVLINPDSEAYLGKQGRAFPARTAQQDSWYDGNNVQDAKPAMDYGIKNSEPYRTTVSWTPINDTYLRYSVPTFNGDGSVDDLLAKTQAQYKG